MFDKVLIANRGEIALRIHRACHEMGIQTVAVHSTADADAMHVRLADESVCIGPAPVQDSYLNIPAVLSAAIVTNANAIHPGYGLLSESAGFAAMVEEHGFTFIGPSADHIKMMGDKLKAKEHMVALGIPVVPGSDGPVRDETTALAIAKDIGFPVLIKAAHGGGGRGMKVVDEPAQLGEALALARREAQAYFGNDEIYMEKYLAHPRHIEFQILADSHHNVVHLGERDCSLQRRHQKLLEEAPSLSLNQKERDHFGGIVTNANAIHPGYGLLSESAGFAAMVEEHGFTFIGPSADHIKMMGDKLKAKEHMVALGIPVVPGSDGPVRDETTALAIAKDIGFPVLIKAAHGGGGRGMKVVDEPAQLGEALALARREAQAYFGNDEIYMEKYLAHPRHIEFQILADSHDNVVHLGERDCSLQRRHQKLLEEAPSLSLNQKERDHFGGIVTKAVGELGYQSAGTLEFLFEDGEFYFIEMNTRLQVEHPITEMISRIDIVREQIRIAAGEKLSYRQKDIKLIGHAIECRINAENPETFIPTPGRIRDYHPPGGLGVRVDSALYSGYRVPAHYDSLIAKLVVHGTNREDCLMRLGRTLEEFVIDGIDTTIPLHQRLIATPDFINGDYDIHWLENFVGMKT